MKPLQTEIINLTAKNAWQCSLALIVLGLLTDIWLRIALNTPTFHSWLLMNEYPMQNIITIFRAGLWIFVAYYFSHFQTVRDFINKVGFNLKPTLFGWWGAWIAVAIATIDHIGVTRGWTSPNRTTREIFHNGGEALFFYILLSVSIVPIYEEVVSRGFLYRAFRGSYGQFLSVVIIICFSAWFHWGAIIHSLWTSTCFFSLWILLCVIREHTGSIWNCVLCHAAYNAAGTVTWSYYAIGMIVVLPFCTNLFRLNSTRQP